jgi:hypothetical protein
LSGRFDRLLPVIILFLSFPTLAGSASAETAAETASKWGLIGRWSLDCGLPPDRDRGAVLAYEVGADGRLLYRRDFGDSSDTADVIAAEVSADKLLNLRAFFPKLKQTREYGLRMEANGSIRAFYNRDQKGNYSIRNGRFSANGKPTPPNHKCSSEAPIRPSASPRSAARSRSASPFRTRLRIDRRDYAASMNARRSAACDDGST